MKIKIKFDTFEVEGELDSNKAAGDIIKFLPLEGKANLWGGEVFVELPEMLPYPGEAEEVEVGALLRTLTRIIFHKSRGVYIFHKTSDKSWAILGLGPYFPQCL